MEIVFVKYFLFQMSFFAGGNSVLQRGLKTETGRTDSLRCGEATAGQTVHRTVCLDRPFESALQMPIRRKKTNPKGLVFFVASLVEMDLRRIIIPKN